MSLPRANDQLVLLHNPRCSKSRAAKALLDSRSIEFEERRYLEEPLTLAELADLRRRLGRPVLEWTRTMEAVFAETGLDRSAGDAELLRAMAEHPVLMERPILVRGARAVVGRPAQNLLELLDAS